MSDMYTPNIFTLTGEVKYRFEDDPEETVRVYYSTPTMDGNGLICIIPKNTFDKPIIILPSNSVVNA